MFDQKASETIGKSICHARLTMYGMMLVRNLYIQRSKKDNKLKKDIIDSKSDLFSNDYSSVDRAIHAKSEN